MRRILALVLLLLADSAEAFRFCTQPGVRSGLFIEKYANSNRCLLSRQKESKHLSISMGAGALFAPVKSTGSSVVIFVKKLIYLLLKPIFLVWSFVSKVLSGSNKDAGRWPPNVTVPPTLKRKATISDLKDISGKTILVRCDLNVPLDNGMITDDTRIRGSIPTIKYLSSKGAKVMLTSHLGRPKNGFEEKFSLAPVAHRLSSLLKQNVKLIPDCIGPSVTKASQNMENGDIILLQNSRFHKEEEKNDKGFALQLAKHADIFVNDAFGTAHRAHVSTEGITSYVPTKVAGFLLQKELEYLQGAVDVPKRPFAAIVGGSKISSKISVIEAMVSTSLNGITPT